MDKQQQIQALLSDIEIEHNVTILLAIESGSRAWGFPSENSDYDIRFIYHHEKDWYISAFPKHDVIDAVFIDDLDAGGWDFTKCLQLLHKGNAPLYDWLHSPIIYREDKVKVELLRELAAKAFNPKMIFHHYLSLAKKKLLDKKTSTNAKSFLYALRALLCARWVVDCRTVPPVEFSRLQSRYLGSGSVAGQLVELLEVKAGLSENDEVKIAGDLMKYASQVFSELTECEVVVSRVTKQEAYDSVLRVILE